jgi:Cytochrome c554 and c-prime
VTLRLAMLAATCVVAMLAPPPLSGETTAEFVRRHWKQPIAAQGAPPPRFSPLEASLEPASCGTCHPVQYADWRGSIHAAASGPGVLGQLVEMWRADPAAASGCYACHAPLAEQRAFIRTPAGFEENPAFVPVLADQGVPCASCHVRNHERFGPPRRDGSLASRAPRESLPHGGVTRTPAFLASEFCRSCHQFEPNGPALNGKLLQDTYNEWKASRFARAGVQCQDCHMPDRRHQWRGIHDPDMVRAGLSITAGTDAVRYRPGDWASLVLTVTSVRVGHAFPTYVTPRAVMRIELVDGEGRVVPGSRTEKIIAREVALDLSKEYFDRRLPPGGRASLAYRPRLSAAGLKARFSVVVEPDAFYVRFFEVLLRQGAGSGEAQIGEALEAARRSPFTVFAREVPLT